MPDPSEVRGSYEGSVEPAQELSGGVGKAPQLGPPDTFDQDCRGLMEGFGEECSRAGVNTLVVVAEDPSGGPVVYFTGDPYRTAKLLQFALVSLRNRINSELGG